MQEKVEKLYNELLTILEREGFDREELKQILGTAHPAELADYIEELHPENKAKVIELLDTAKAAEVLHEINSSGKQEVLKHIQEDKLSNIIDELPTNLAADIIHLLPETRENAVLGNMEDEKRDEIKSLLQYPPQTAGGLMTTNFVSIPEDLTAAETLKIIQGAVNAETVEYVYAITEDDKLRGVCSLRSLLRASPETKISQIMRKNVTSVNANLDQEEVANIARKYGLKGVPVVDNNNTLLGVVTLDHILQVIHNEAQEDISKMAGVQTYHPTVATIRQRAFARIPWLTITLSGELVLAYFMQKFFSTTIEKNWFLALFFPVNNAVAGNLGLQSSTIVTRGLATGEVKSSKIVKMLLDETQVGIIIGLFSGIITGLVAYLLGWKDIGFVICIAMTLGLTIAAISGIIMPFIFYKLKKDPALAAGPLISALNDIICTLIYLGTAFLILANR